MTAKNLQKRAAIEKTNSLLINPKARVNLMVTAEKTKLGADLNTKPNRKRVHESICCHFV